MSAVAYIGVDAELEETPAPLPALRAVPTEAYDPAEERVVAAERAVDEHAYGDALAALEGLHGSSVAPPLAFRAVLAESWARMYLGQLDTAVGLLEHALLLAEGPLDRAEALYRLGCCRLGLSEVPAAITLLTSALELCWGRPDPATSGLCARILDWRSRCYQRQREFAAASADVERALELAERSGDERTIAQVYFQASIVAERQRQWLVARMYAEEALARCERLGDRENAHRVLNNLGGIHFLLGDRDQAVEHLKAAFRLALELGDDVGAGYSMNSLAQVQLRGGEHAEAESHARKALELLGDRQDHLAEIGNAQLVLGRSLLELGRHDEAERALQAADESFARLGSASHRSAVWVAQGDLAARQGLCQQAAERYRAAAESLQDFNF